MIKKERLRGTWRIRTAVNGFADRYLATRSRYPIGGTRISLKRTRRYAIFSRVAKDLPLSLRKEQPEGIAHLAHLHDLDRSPLMIALQVVGGNQDP
jgi:hypothetical protein